MEAEADDDAVYWGGDGFRRQAQKILRLAEAAEQCLLPDEHVVLVDETSDPEAITQPTNYPTAGHASNSAGTSSMPETRHGETEVLLHQETRNKLQEYLLMHRQRVEECCKAYRNGRSVCLRSHELQPREPSTILLCCLCGGQRPSNFCMTCDECSWDACRQCIEYLRDKVARLENHALELQKAEDGLSVGFSPCFDPKKPLHFISFTAVAAALEPSHQKLAICLESIQVTQILHEMPLPNARHSQTLKEAASEMRNPEIADMLLKVSSSLAPKQFMPPNCATSPGCRRAFIGWLLWLLCVAAALPLLAYCIRFHEQNKPTRRIYRSPYQKDLLAPKSVTPTFLGLMLETAQLHKQSRLVRVRELSSSALRIIHKLLPSLDKLSFPIYVWQYKNRGTDVAIREYMGTALAIVGLHFFKSKRPVKH